MVRMYRIKGVNLILSKRLFVLKTKSINSKDIRSPS